MGEQPINNPESTQETGKTTPQADNTQKADLYAEYTETSVAENTCTEQGCVIPKKSPTTKSESTSEQLDPRWNKANTLTDAKSMVKSGDLILIGASWCHACKDAKKNIPQANPGVKLVYVQLEDENENDIMSQVKTTPNEEPTLPIILKCETPTLFKKINYTA